MEGESESQRALRVTQLDAAELDHELFDLLKSQLTTTFKYFKPEILTRYSPEINACLRFILWKYTIQNSASSVGQKLLNLTYKNNQGGTGSQWMTDRQKVLLAAITILLPWLLERIPELETLTEDWPFMDKFWDGVRWLEKIHKVAALVNFLIFLRQGVYRSITERLLRITPVFPRPQGVRQTSFEFMERELLWHGFAEFLFFLLPLINFRRMKNYVRKKLRRSPTEGGEVREHKDLVECVVCGEWPFQPRQIGCKHIMCYYCVTSNREADANFSCPSCGKDIPELDDIKPVTFIANQLS